MGKLPNKTSFGGAFRGGEAEARPSLARLGTYLLLSRLPCVMSLACSLASCPWPAPSGADECCPIYDGVQDTSDTRKDGIRRAVRSGNAQSAISSRSHCCSQRTRPRRPASQPYPSSKVRFCHRVLRNPSGWETLARLNRGSQKSHHGRSFQPHASSPATRHPLPTRSFMPELSQVTPPLF